MTQEDEAKKPRRGMSYSSATSMLAEVCERVVMLEERVGATEITQEQVVGHLTQ
eukprot:CAMPEP_0114520608 /NCGR_PEP_ID=MMETSP0109-20121206/19692_1 /TAXON_ID=29199 /ORGANISM="Chlorarachnion reptans, Strain CCCM449" /LENGTH=53 /DNA_ID=CAMNT_0001701555 /DNA_START=3 /DNA_END=161 /DNA_ORIENTATION=-